MITIHHTDNYAAIQEIAKQTWPATYSSILSSEQIQYMFSMMYDLSALKDQAEVQKHQFIVAEEDGNFLGFSSYELDYQNTATAKIHKIYILPQTQGKGIGKKIIHFIAEDAKKNNQLFLSLNVNRLNEAFKFYEKMGFEKMGEEDINIGNGYVMEDYIMHKKIG